MRAYIEDLPRRRLAVGTITYQARALHSFMCWSDERGIDPLTASTEDLQRFRQWVCEEMRSARGAPASVSFQSHSLATVRQWYAWLVAAGQRPEAVPATVLTRTGPRRAGPTVSHHADLTVEMAQFVRWLTLECRVGTARSIELSLRQFAFWCGAHDVRSLRLTRDQAEEYQVWLTQVYRKPNGRPLRINTVATRLANLKSWYEWLIDRHMIISNPTTGLAVREERSRQVLRDHLSLQEATALIETQARQIEEAAPDSRQRAQALGLLAALCIGLATGRRVFGIASMKVQQIDLERQEVRIDVEKGQTGRILPIAAWAMDCIALYLREGRPLLAAATGGPWVFPGHDGTGHISTDTLMRALPQLIAATIAANPDLEDLPTKRRLTWHSLRVTFATLLFSAGCPIRSVNELMLHRSLSTTARYTPIPIEDMQQVWRQAHPRS